jgi:hypothetical protein
MENEVTLSVQPSSDGIVVDQEGTWELRQIQDLQIAKELHRQQISDIQKWQHNATLLMCALPFCFLLVGAHLLTGKTDIPWGNFFVLAFFGGLGGIAVFGWLKRGLP